MRRIDPDGQIRNGRLPAWGFETVKASLDSKSSPLLPIGTKSLLFGYHCFFLHPFFVALAWWRLFGFPWDPRLWVAFVVHDLGYWGSPDLDGERGEDHPVLGARIMSALFDHSETDRITMVEDVYGRWFPLGRWGMFSLLHSRFLARGLGEYPSALCVADKLAICLYPEWLFMGLVRATGEIREYMKDAKEAEYRPSAPDGPRFSREQEREWFLKMREYVARWVDTHKDGGPDTMTPEKGGRTTIDESGVWR